jgi:hypothetical protein
MLRVEFRGDTTVVLANATPETSKVSEAENDFPQPLVVCLSRQEWLTCLGCIVETRHTQQFSKE